VFGVALKGVGVQTIPLSFSHELGQAMERQLRKSIVQVIEEVNKQQKQPRCHYSVLIILKVWFWAVIHDRPVRWACQRSNWAIWEHRLKLPSESTMSRRLRSKHVLKVLAIVESRVLRNQTNGTIFWSVDGKALVVGGCSKDPHANYGRAAGGYARGYKLHAIVGSNGIVANWRIAPMSKDERVMAKRMIKGLPISGYLLADGNYDSNPLHRSCQEHGNLQLVSPRRGGPNKALGHRKQSEGRLRSKEILEAHDNDFGRQLMIDRVAIERFFGNLVNGSMGLSCLPSWVRTYPRVHRWVQAKMIINAQKSHHKILSCAA